MSQAPEPHDLGTSGTRLVVVDDEPGILELLVSLFDDGPDVVGFASGSEALAHLQAHGCDVLLTDKNLPDVGGLELLAAARAADPDAEGIVITGYASLETAVAALQQGAFDYIVKPPRSIFDVKRKVEQALEKVQIARENRRLVDDLRVKNAALEEALAEVRQVQGELVQSEKLAGIGTLAAGIAHEVSSPLFGVLGLAEAIGEEDDLDTIHAHAGEIVSYARSIKEIVQQLSGYARSADRDYLEPVDLGGVVTDAVRLVVRTLGLPVGLVDVDVEPDAICAGRASELQQIFVNLVKNAVEAVADTHPDGGGHVAVRVWRGDGEIVGTVADDGPGIPEDALHEIFDPFFTTKAPGKGTGLGLNIVYRLVTKYRGAVSVESKVGEGTTFSVRFPVQAA